MMHMTKTSRPDDTSLGRLQVKARNLFLERYGSSPRWLVAAPGRVNLIGEHTDYNGGYVLPMAIDRYVVIAAAPKRNDGDPAASVFSANLKETASISVSGQIEPGRVSWSSYVQGVVAGFVSRGLMVEPFDAVVLSNVPLGAGLSSSAALEVAVATLLELTCEAQLDPIDKALLCQQAEHDFANVPCGIMDQFSSVMCQQDMLMLLDCRSQEAVLIPFHDANVTVLITNSNVKHKLNGGEYESRRAQCEAAATVLGVSTLRDATRQQLSAAQNALDPSQFRRASHVIGEIERTADAAHAIAAGNWERVGQLMYASHESLRNDFEVSCDELDLLVDLARSIGPGDGVIGSRMTGAGFGGCTVSLVRTKSVPSVMQRIHDGYRKQTNIEPAIFTSRPAKGAHVISQPRHLENC